MNPDDNNTEMPQPMYQQSIADDTLGSLHYQIDHTDIINDIEQNLRSEKIVHHNGQSYVQKTGLVPLINDTGIQTIITILKSYLNKINILSDLSKPDIHDTIRYITEDLTDDFYMNWEKYGIKDYPTGSLIIQIIASSVNSTLCKGDGGNYLKLLRHMHTITEVQQQNMRAPQNNDGIGARIRDLLTAKKR